MSNESNILKVRHGIVLPYTSDNKGGVCDENMCFIAESANTENWFKAGGMYKQIPSYRGGV